MNPTIQISQHLPIEIHSTLKLQIHSN